jgi:hypothetical protein
VGDLTRGKVIQRAGAFGEANGRLVESGLSLRASFTLRYLTRRLIGIEVSSWKSKNGEKKEKSHEKVAFSQKNEVYGF